MCYMECALGRCNSFVTPLKYFFQTLVTLPKHPVRSFAYRNQ